MQTMLCISCYFGYNKISIHPAPKPKNCVFFSNNIDVKEEALQNGWRFEYVPKELSSDPVMSSLQSKYIKFLIFLQDFERYRSYFVIWRWKFLDFSNVIYRCSPKPQYVISGLLDFRDIHKHTHNTC